MPNLFILIQSDISGLIVYLREKLGSQVVLFFSVVDLCQPYFYVK